MLRIEDCKPGVEVIRIKSHTPGVIYVPNLIKLGHIYTIKSYNGFYKYVEGVYPTIYLNEVQAYYIGNDEETPFSINRFKLVDPKALQVFHDMLSKPLDKKILEDA